MQRNIKKYINILETSRSENSKSSSFAINKMIQNHLTVALDTMHIMQYTWHKLQKKVFSETCHIIKLALHNPVWQCMHINTQDPTYVKY